MKRLACQLDQWALKRRFPCGESWADGYDALLLAKLGITLPWWSLPQRQLSRDCFVTWWQAPWWGLAKWRVFGPLFRLAIRSGVWQVKHPFGRYVEGRLRWPDMWTRR